MSSASTFPMPLRAVLALLALVLLAHAALLSSTPTAPSAAAGSATALRTRQIEANPSPPDAAPAPAALPTAAANPPPEPTPAPISAPTPVPVAPRKKPLSPTSLQPNLPLAQLNIAQTAPEVIAKIAPMEDEPHATPTVPPLTPPLTPPPSPPDEPAPLAQPAPAISASAPAAAGSPAAATPRSATELAQREADAAQRSALALRFPGSGELSYNAVQISGGQPKNGSGTLKWTTDGSQYQLRLESTVLGFTVLSQSSVGQLGADGLQPDRFSDKRGLRSEKAAHFQRDTGKITFSGRQTSTALQSGAQDRLSMLLQLAAMAAGSAAQLTQAGQIAFQVSNTEEADTWVFLVQAPEQTEVPAGQTLALHVVRNPRKEFDSRLELWLAPSLGYLPARILQTEANGNTLELQLRSPALR